MAELKTKTRAKKAVSKSADVGAVHPVGTAAVNTKHIQSNEKDSRRLVSEHTQKQACLSK